LPIFSESTAPWLETTSRTDEAFIDLYFNIKLQLLIARV
jgi:hypothetical protein